MSSLFRTFFVAALTCIVSCAGNLRGEDGGASTATGAGALADAGSPAANSTTSTLEASPPFATADGAATTELRVTLLDANGEPLCGAMVDLSSTGSGNTFGASTGTTNALGVFSTTLASTVAESKVITATSGALTSTATVTFTAGRPSPTTSTISATPDTVDANGTATATLSISLRDANGNVVVGVMPVLSASLGAKFAQPGVTDSSGQTSGTVASTLRGSQTITASVDGTPIGSVSVSFVDPHPDAVRSTVVVSPSSVEANGSSRAMVRVKVMSSVGTPVLGRRVSLAFSRSATVTPATVTTDEAGLATFLVSSRTAGSGGVQATVDPDVVLAQTPTLTFTVPTVAVRVLLRDLSTSSLVLQQPGLPDLTLNAGAESGEFAGQLPVGSAFDVSVKTQPVGLFCDVTGGSGVVGQVPVIVSLSCGRAWWVKVAAGLAHTVAIKTDGTLWAWGDNSAGQLGDGTTASRIAPVQIGTDSNWASVVARGNQTLALKTDGTLWAWGDNSSGQLGDGSTTARMTPVQVGTDSNWATVAAGLQHTLALKTDGTLWAWGSNGASQLGDGTTTPRASPGQVGTDSDWTSVAAGGFHSVAVKVGGTLWSWGSNQNGQLGTGNTLGRAAPAQVGSLSTWGSVAAGSSHTVATKTDGTLWGWGDNRDGQLGNVGAFLRQNAPYQIGCGWHWVSAAAGEDTLAIKADGTLWAWDWRGFGQVGSAANWASVASSDRHDAAVKTNGTVWSWGSGSTFGVSGQPPATIPSAVGWSRVAAANHTLGIQRDGTLWAWGSNQLGELGVGTFIDYAVPVQVGTDSNWVALAAGSTHSVAVKSDGTLWAWGDNRDRTWFPMLRALSPIQRDVPVQVGSDSNWAAVTAGQYHSVALKTDGTLWIWGSGVALGDAWYSEAPVQVGTDSKCASVAAGHAHTVAILTDGTLWAWGDNASGQLGDGSTSPRSAPVQVGSDSNWAAVGAGWNHTVALKTDGTLWAWGDNQSGQLGDGTFLQRAVPVQVGTDSNWASVVAGNGESLAFKTDGTLWAWGYSRLGISPLNTPVQVVAPSSSWTSVAEGLFHTAAVTADGSLWAWGSNEYGQLARPNLGAPGMVP